LKKPSSDHLWLKEILAYKFGILGSSIPMRYTCSGLRNMYKIAAYISFFIGYSEQKQGKSIARHKK